MMLEPASAADLAVVAGLMNRAYREGGAGAGWTHEADYIGGQRTSAAVLAGDLKRAPGARLLLLRQDGAPVACVWLEPVDRGLWYLGSLTVEPALQNGGTGRRLLEAAEDWIAGRGGRRVRMTVVHLRDALIAWYGRRGYRRTGETEAFPYGDERFGIPRRPDLHFIVLEKDLAPAAPA
jgi:GNAT superfamily N-acetyltransferase